MENNFYLLLGVAKDATPEQIKSAYRKKIMFYHPDHNPNKPEYKEEFRRIQESYDTLRDPIKRKKYDRTGFVGHTEAELKAKAYNHLRDKIVNIINNQKHQIFELNIIDVINNHCHNSIETDKKQIDELIKHKDHLNKVHKRFRRKSSIDDDYMRLIFIEQIANCNNRINELLSMIQILERVTTIINTYSIV